MIDQKTYRKKLNYGFSEMKLRIYMQTSILAVLIFTAIFIALRLLTAKYPTHSDVFWIGVECGALAILLFGILLLGFYLLTRLAIQSDKPKQRFFEKQIIQNIV